MCLGQHIGFIIYLVLIHQYRFTILLSSHGRDDYVIFALFWSKTKKKIFISYYDRPHFPVYYTGKGDRQFENTCHHPFFVLAQNTFHFHYYGSII